MKKNEISPKQMIIAIMVLINTVIIREGSLQDGRLYLFLIGTIPLLFYLILNRRRRAV
jgi:hypothetical protein